VRIAVPAAPEWLGRCNCSFCKRTGSLMAYYPDPGGDDGGVSISGETAAYVWGDGMISHHHCRVCGCFTDWRSTGESYGKVGINARLLDGYSEQGGKSLFGGRGIEVRAMENAA